MSWYGFFKALAWLLTRTLAPVRVEGREGLPGEGGCFLVANHASALDPLFIQSSIARNDVHTMTKSTQFARRASGWALRRVRTFPVRRYTVDPQAVRTCLRLVGRGRIVCVFVEGERSWDGSLQPLQRGTVRMLLKSGVPVVPVGITGSWDVRPRWGRTFQRRPVTVRFGAPLEFAPMDRKRERERALPEALRRIEDELRNLTRTVPSPPEQP